MIRDPPLHPFPCIFGGVVDLLATLENQGSGRTSVDTHPASETSVGIEGCSFTPLVSGQSAISEPQGLDRTSLHAKTARLAGCLINFNTVIGEIMTLILFQYVVRLKKDAGTLAAITDRVRALLPV